MIIAETENFRLRQLVPDDDRRLFEICSDPETWRFMGAGPASITEVRAGIERQISDYYGRVGYGLWGIEQKYDRRLVGRCGIFLQTLDGLPRPELSYVVDRTFWGRGIATEAAKCAIALAAARYGISSLIAVIADGNAASIRVAENCGFTISRQLSAFKDFGPVRVYSLELSKGGC
ncbi:MAG: GNAT family N-acetyltransferase [Acidobacteriota bacterium]